MTPIDTHMKVKNKVSLFLCLHDNISKNLLLSNVDTSNILSNNNDDDVNLRKTLSIASTVDGT